MNEKERGESLLNPAENPEIQGADQAPDAFYEGKKFTPGYEKDRLPDMAEATGIKEESAKKPKSLGTGLDPKQEELLSTDDGTPWIQAIR